LSDLLITIIYIDIIQRDSNLKVQIRTILAKGTDVVWAIVKYIPTHLLCIIISTSIAPIAWYRPID